MVKCLKGISFRFLREEKKTAEREGKVISFLEFGFAESSRSPFNSDEKEREKKKEEDRNEYGRDEIGLRVKRVVSLNPIRNYADLLIELGYIRQLNTGVDAGSGSPDISVIMDAYAGTFGCNFFHTCSQASPYNLSTFSFISESATSLVLSVYVNIALA